MEEKILYGEKKYFKRPALEYLEGRCLCTSQGLHHLSDSERGGFSRPNNLKIGKRVTYMYKGIAHGFIRR